MTTSHHSISSAFRHLVECGLSGLAHWLASFRRERRLASRRNAASHPAHHQQHFGSLDDQMLADLGLQRSEIRAAEYGVLPGDQALHHEAAEDSPDDDAGRAPQARR